MALHDDNLSLNEAQGNRSAESASRNAGARDVTLATADGYSANGTEQNPQALNRRGENAAFAMPGGVTRLGDYETSDGFDVKRLGQILMRRRRVILAVFVLVFASIAAWTLRATPIYRATAMIRMTNSQDDAAGSIPGVSELLPGTLAERTVATEMQLIDTEALRQRAAQRLPKDYQAILKKYSQVDVNDVRDSYLISVSVDSPSRQASVAYANAICQTYVDESREKNRAQMRQASAYIQQQIDQVSDDLDKARARLEASKNQAGIPDIQTATNTQMARLGQMQTDFGNAQAEHRAAESRLRVLEAQLRGLPRSLPFSTQLGESAATTALNDQIAKLEVERVSAIKEYAPGAPEIRDIDEQIASLRQRLARENRSVAKQETININPIWQTTAQSVAELRGQIASFAAREKALSEGIGQLKTRVALLPSTERRLATIMARVQSLELAQASFSEKKQTVDVQVYSRQGNGELAVPATDPKYAVAPRVTRNLVLGFVLGILLALGFAVLIDVLDDRVHSDEDVRMASGLPVLTHVPDIKEIAQQTLAALPGVSAARENAASSPTTTLAAASHYHAAPLLESFRMLRANIMFSATVEPIHSIVVTSSRPAEGKSSSALNLAIALAMDGKDVILVDCDLRRPKVHELLGLRNNIGFTSVVTGQMELDKAMQPSGVANLRVLTGGPVPPNPTELLNSRAGRTCLQQLMRQAEFLILDTPPALVMADAQVVASQADAVLLVVSANEADKREVSRTTELMSQTGARMLGTVLNKSDVSTGGYYNYRTYSAYYSRPNEDDDAGGDGGQPVVDGMGTIAQNGHQNSALNGHSVSSGEVAHSESSLRG